jgi:hypothetical protein
MNLQINRPTIFPETLMATGFSEARLSVDTLGMACELESVSYMFKTLLKQRTPLTSFHNHLESRYKDEWAIVENLRITYGK